MKKPTVAVVFGSRSTEHDISILTALAAIIKPLEMSQKYNVLPVYIAKDGRWFAGSKFKDVIEVIEGNALEVNLPKNVDVVIAELIETGLMDEMQVPVMNDMHKQGIIGSKTKVIPQANQQT